MGDILLDIHLRLVALTKCLIDEAEHKKCCEWGMTIPELSGFPQGGEHGLGESVCDELEEMVVMFQEE
jgi:hypothetical protein